MSFSLTVRFSKNDNYSNPVFICSPKNDVEKASYTKLCLLAEKIGESNINTFSPLYHNAEHEFATIRFKYYNKCSFIILYPSEHKLLENVVPLE